MIKEYNDSTWQGKAYSKIVDTTQQVTSFPVVVRPMENTIPSWTIKGNMSQTGTPTPQNPIQPSETGDRTGNLFDVTGAQSGYITADGTVISGHDNLMYTDYIAIPDGVTYITQSYGGSLTAMNAPALCFYDSAKTYITGEAFGNVYDKTFTVPNGAVYIRTCYRTTMSWVMLNTGSSPLPYQPYGYKLDIKSGNTTTPVYLGEVQTTRKIKKLVLDGTEDWTAGAGNSRYIISVNNIQNYAICSHFVFGDSLDSNEFDVVPNRLQIRFNNAGYTTLEAWQIYLAQQYSAGTPVTVWYVLATETTGIVNEPLRKIGTYSDSVSGTNLSVTAQSPTTIDVDTTLKPSEMDLTYTGLKMCGRKKYAGLLTDNPLCGIGDYKDTLNLETGTVTRILKKYEFTGQENWIRTNSGYFYTGNAFSDYNNTQTLYRKRSSMFSHYIATWNDTNGNSLSDGYACLYCSNGSPNNYHEVYIRDNSYSTANDFKAYLAQQYAAGTPVTVWYVLTTATTETIAVPEGLTGTVEGYLTQSDTPTPSNPIYPTANSVPFWR